MTTKKHKLKEMTIFHNKKKKKKKTHPPRGGGGEKGRILNDIGNFENPKIALIISVMV